MARHNRWGQGTDQRGFHYQVSYAPDWLDRIRVARRLPSGRQSTKTLFRNPARAPKRNAGSLVRTKILCPEQNLRVEIMLQPTPGRVTKMEVDWQGREHPDPRMDRITFTLVPFRLHGRVATGGGRRERA